MKREYSILRSDSICISHDLDFLFLLLILSSPGGPPLCLWVARLAEAENGWSEPGRGWSSLKREYSILRMDYICISHDLDFLFLLLMLSSPAVPSCFSPEGHSLGRQNCDSGGRGYFMLIYCCEFDLMYTPSRTFVVSATPGRWQVAPTATLSSC